MDVDESAIYRRAFEMLNGPARKALVEMFIKSRPLESLLTASEWEYDKKGVRRSQVIRAVKAHPTFRTFVVFHKCGLLSSQGWTPYMTPRQFLLRLERKLCTRGKLR